MYKSSLGHRAGVRMMQLGTRLEYVGSLQRYQKLVRMAQGSSPEEDRDLPQDCQG
ncbi:hypothetical protein B296_00003659 [Ensete ventricosum]|uniref:Uncharacterized protein n=1 Tax=Ensete ventricosum TaxID=4639 RepID=A0A426ZFJ4_ENSVE|nr:hypothetical protein B296_00003659 [Ensete ventricosum]